jgi:hypothetical protein
MGVDINHYRCRTVLAQPRLPGRVRRLTSSARNVNPSELKGKLDTKAQKI